jgi:hypothetical protein
MTQEHSALPCFKCGKQIEIEPFTQGLRHAMPFITHGGYGSTVYDPMGGYSLRIHVCDDCVRAAGEQGIVLEATTLRQPDKVTYEKWVPYRGQACELEHRCGGILLPAVWLSPTWHRSAPQLDSLEKRR